MAGTKHHLRRFVIRLAYLDNYIRLWWWQLRGQIPYVPRRPDGPRVRERRRLILRLAHIDSIIKARRDKMRGRRNKPIILTYDD